MNKEQYFKEAHQAMMECDTEKCLQIYEQAVTDGVNPTELLSQGYSSGIQEAGDLFSAGEIFLPELIFMTEIMKQITEKVEATLDCSESENKGIMVIATVEGDVHDIGKGIVASMIKTSGFTVYDLGREVPVESIIAKAEEVGAHIIGTSALLTTTMTEQKKLEDMLTAKGIRNKYKTMIGGAPVTQRWAEKIGADAYSEDATEAVKVALELLKG